MMGVQIEVYDAPPLLIAQTGENEPPLYTLICKCATTRKAFLTLRTLPASPIYLSDLLQPKTQSFTTLPFLLRRQGHPCYSIPAPQTTAFKTLLKFFADPTNPHQLAEKWQKSRMQIHTTPYASLAPTPIRLQPFQLFTGTLTTIPPDAPSTRISTDGSKKRGKEGEMECGFGLIAEGWCAADPENRYKSIQVSPQTWEDLKTTPSYV